VQQTGDRRSIAEKTTWTMPPQGLAGQLLYGD